MKAAQSLPNKFKSVCSIATTIGAVTLLVACGPLRKDAMQKYNKLDGSPVNNTPAPVEPTLEEQNAERAKKNQENVAQMTPGFGSPRTGVPQAGAPTPPEAPAPPPPPIIESYEVKVRKELIILQTLAEGGLVFEESVKGTPTILGKVAHHSVDTELVLPPEEAAKIPGARLVKSESEGEYQLVWQPDGAFLQRQAVAANVNQWSQEVMMHLVVKSIRDSNTKLQETLQKSFELPEMQAALKKSFVVRVSRSRQLPRIANIRVDQSGPFRQFDANTYEIAETAIQNAKVMVLVDDPSTSHTDDPSQAPKMTIGFHDPQNSEVIKVPANGLVSETSAPVRVTESNHKYWAYQLTLNSNEAFNTALKNAVGRSNNMEHVLARMDLEVKTFTGAVSPRRSIEFQVRLAHAGAHPQLKDATTFEVDRTTFDVNNMPTQTFILHTPNATTQNLRIFVDVRSFSPVGATTATARQANASRVAPGTPQISCEQSGTAPARSGTAQLQGGSNPLTCQVRWNACDTKVQEGITYQIQGRAMTIVNDRQVVNPNIQLSFKAVGTCPTVTTSAPSTNSNGTGTGTINHQGQRPPRQQGKPTGNSRPPRS